MKNLKPGNKRCICPTCHESFNTVRAFDKHRRGNYREGRACMSAGEMYDIGMRENSDGYWVTKLREYQR